jgi:hypothetical protein
MIKDRARDGRRVIGAIGKDETGSLSKMGAALGWYKSNIKNPNAKRGLEKRSAKIIEKSKGEDLNPQTMTIGAGNVSTLLHPFSKQDAKEVTKQEMKQKETRLAAEHSERREKGRVKKIIIDSNK